MKLSIELFIWNLSLQISGCMADKSGGMRITSMQMKDMNTGRNIPPQYERRKDAPVSKGRRRFNLSVIFCVPNLVSRKLGSSYMKGVRGSKARYT